MPQHKAASNWFICKQNGPMTRLFLSVPLLLGIAVSLTAQEARNPAPPAFLKKGARLALVGDSITEQKAYTRFVEDYLLMCAPETQAEVCQFGWGGEIAAGFLGRMDAAFDWFKPDAVTVFYGMNDGNRAIYVGPMEKIAAKLKQNRISAILVSPGAVDTYYGLRGGDRNFPVGFNKEQGLMGIETKRIAAANDLRFADLHTPLLDIMAKAKERYHPNYDVCGADGVHPRANGHLIIAWTILKALGMSGDIGTITVSMQGGSKASYGHKILSDITGKVEIESIRYPFCFIDEGKKLSPDQPAHAGSTAGIVPLFSFNDDLNRFILVVNGLECNKAKVTWGNTSKVFSKIDLEKGINLAAQFIDNPFREAFAKVNKAVMEKQKTEGVLIKNIIGGAPLPKPTPAANGTTAPESRKLTKSEAIAQRTELLQVERGAVQPVRHQIIITKAD